MKGDLKIVETLYDFLRGSVPDGFVVPPDHMPNLGAVQAWTVVWYLQGLYAAIPDTIVQCGVCGNLYDEERGGDCRDYGDAPYTFCDSCMREPQYRDKLAAEPKENDR